jgi:predicted Zn-dependent peptidase
MNLRKSFEIITHELENGLKIVLIPKNNAEIISMNLAYKVGSKNEVQGKTGMAHLFEHLMFEGSKNIPKGAFDKKCSLAGGTNNAYTSYDYTAYTMTVPSNQLEVALWLESDRMQEFAVTKEAMETQKKVVSDEIRQTIFDRPYGKWRELLATTSFQDKSSYSWEVHGSIEDVQNVKLDYLKEFFEMYYRPGNAILTLSGKFNKENAIELISKYFCNIENKTNNCHRPPFDTSMLKKGKYVSFTDTVPLPATFINFHIPSMLDGRILIASVISQIATQGRSSRLYLELVEQKQIASSLGSYVDEREYTSLLTFYGTTSKPEIELNSLKSEILEMIGKFKTESVSEQELQRAVNQLTAQVANEIQYSSGIADIASSNLLFSEELDRIYAVLERYKKISSDDILEFANDFLTSGSEIIIDCLPQNQE